MSAEFAFQTRSSNTSMITECFTSHGMGSGSLKGPENFKLINALRLPFSYLFIFFLNICLIVNTEYFFVSKS